MAEERKAYGILKLRDTWVVAESTHASMVANRSKDTRPEQTLRKALWAAGLRGYRKNVRTLPGRPDVVYGRAKLAVFVHGCFWHGCPLCGRRRIPKTNRAYWEAKFQQNAERDARNLASLEAAGYRVLVLWECQLRGDGLQRCVQAVREALGR
ncbi:MAG: very short patch repair endonuclease [Fimbriimonadales bacterium]|nr:very short patch repair endonuclease [Fimbriimonadales bacterium]